MMRSDRARPPMLVFGVSDVPGDQFDRGAMPGPARRRPVARHQARQEFHKGHKASYAL